MISNSDLEKAWFLYKTEYEPQNISINDFCMRKGIPIVSSTNGFVIHTSKLSLWRLKESRTTRGQPLLNQIQLKFLI